MYKFIKILIILFLVNTNIVFANDEKNNTCIYVTVKEGSTYKITKIGNCSENSKTIIYVNKKKKQFNIGEHYDK